MTMATEVELYVPDGGWGWIIVACSFLIHMFVVGTIYALSVLYVAWLDYFGDGKGITSWIISIAVAVMFGIGPVPGAMCRRFGNRVVVIVGGLSMGLGFLASSFAVNVYFLVVSVGIVVGTGGGCCYLPSVSMVAMYFTSKRSIAMGVAASGLGAGAFFMAPFLDMIVNLYGWRGCMLILSGISLNMCVLGSLMRPLETAPRCRNCRWMREGDVVSADYSSIRSLAVDDFNVVEGCVDDCERECKETCGDRAHSGGLIGACRSPNACLYNQLPVSEGEPGVTPVAYFPSHFIVIHQNQTQLYKNIEKGPVLDCSLGQNDLPLDETVPLDQTHDNTSIYTDTDVGSKTKHVVTDHESSSLRPVNKWLNVSGSNTPKLGGSAQCLNSPNFKTILAKKQFSSEMELRHRKNVKSPEPDDDFLLNDMQIMMTGSVGSILHMKETKKTISRLTLPSRQSALDLQVPAASSVLTLDPEYSFAYEEDMEDEDNRKETYCSKLMQSLDNYTKLMQNKTFLIFGVSNFLTNLSFFMPVLYMVDRALDSGIEKGEAAMLVSLYGAGNIFGKLFFGWLADRGLLDRLIYYIACLTVCGLSTCVSPVCGSSHVLHSIYAFVFGCFIGGYVTLLPVVTVDLMGVSDVMESFGLLLFFMGIATAFGTPLAGWIFDWTGSYTISFILHGVFILLSAFMLIPLLILKRRQNNNNLKI